MLLQIRCSEKYFSKEVLEHGSIQSEEGGTGISAYRIFHKEGNIKYKGLEAESLVGVFEEQPKGQFSKTENRMGTDKSFRK